MQFLIAFVLSAVSAFAEDHHEAKNATVKSYDAAHHDLVVVVDGHDVHLHTEHAVLHGAPAAGKHVDVKWDGDQAKEITVH
jgi:hypothetical protein